MIRRLKLDCLETYILISLLLLAFVLRFNEIENQSIWFDEAFSWTLVTDFSFYEMINRIAQDVHPPFYYIILRLWVSIFGDSVVAMRLLSALCGTATVLAIYVFCIKCSSLSSGYLKTVKDISKTSISPVPIYSASILAVSTFHIHWSQQTRMYTLGTLLAVLTGLLLIRAIERSCILNWSLYVACAVCFVYTHNYALFMIMGNVLFGFLYYITFKHLNVFSLSSWKTISPFTISHLVIFCFYIPWIHVILKQTSQVRDNYWMGSLHWWSIPEYTFKLAFPTNGNTHISHVYHIVFFLSIIGIIVLFIKSREWPRWFVLLQVIVPVVIASVISLVLTPIIVPRQLMFVMMYVICMIAFVCGEIVPPKMWLLPTIFFITSGILIHNNFIHNELKIDSRPGARGAVSHLLLKYNQGDHIIVRHPSIYFSVRYYLRNNDCNPFLYLPSGKTLHWTGGPILKESYLVKGDDLKNWLTNELWVIDTSGFNRPGYRSSIPEVWQTKNKTRVNFRDVYDFQKDISCTCYTRASQQLP